ncbi:MAG: HAD family phosphatase [Clostridia bacterium]|nr:HAD family phosphatase [Clostridia bacterium]
MIRAVIFDMDGTLLDTERIYAAAWRAAGEELQFAQTEEALAACTGRNLTDIRRYFEEHYAGVMSFDLLQTTRERYYEHAIASGGVPLKPGATALLAYLKSNGIKIALATSTGPERTRYNLSSTGLLPYFDVLVTGEDVTHGKPHPETFLTAAARLGVAPQACMGVEDSFNGVRAIRAAGMVTVMVPDTVSPTDEIRALLDAECQTLAEIQPVIEKYNQ